VQPDPGNSEKRALTLQDTRAARMAVDSVLLVAIHGRRGLRRRAAGTPLAELAARIPPTPILFIASTWAIERKAALLYARAAGERGDLWEVDAGHTQGLRDHPQEYARRVIGFFNRTLRPSSQ
jgi:hypothetical protein